MEAFTDLWSDSVVYKSENCETHRMTTQTSTQKRRAVSPVLIGFVGMIVVPLCIVLATTSWDAPNGADFVRMAFGTVIATTLATVTAWWLAFDRMKAGRSDRYWFWSVAGIVTLSSIGSIFSVAETLLAQLTNL
ncbi:hypothetical protein [Cryobacterium sp. M25]|uniref:hypothetical protein n=1 Tax=Cryobacterium sp. M25 TaxID=2048293 RepID=UPI000CE4DF2B|nr:hypothetical protein [Cryobacterium sp. M25]